MGFSSKAFTDQPVAKVWDFLADIENNGSKWLTAGGTTIMKVSSGELGVGTVFRFNARGKDRHTMISRFEEGSLMCLTSVQGSVTANYVYRVVPHGEGCAILLDVQCKLNGWLNLFGPILSLLMRMVDGGHPQRIKAAVEAEATT